MQVVQPSPEINGYIKIKKQITEFYWDGVLKF